MNQSTISLQPAKKINHSIVPKLSPALVPVQRVKEPSIEFTLALAHEIRNPLTTIKLAAEMLQSIIADKDQKAFLDMILRGSGRITDIVTDLLTPILAEKMQSVGHSIYELLDEVITMSESRLQLKGVTVCKIFGAPDCTLVFDRPKMKIALTNIIVNAVEAMPQGGKLTLVTRSIGQKFIVQIGDNGCGISKENLKNIFKPYFTNKPDGLGLGLAATYDILRAAHVIIRVESLVGVGTYFDLLFPKRRSPFRVKSVKKVLLLDAGKPVSITDAFQVSTGS